MSHLCKIKQDMQHTDFRLVLTAYPQRGVTYFIVIVVLARKILEPLGKVAGNQSCVL